MKMKEYVVPSNYYDIGCYVLQWPLIYLRKTICGGCGNFITEGTLCECKIAARAEYEKTYQRDPLISSYRWKKKREYIKRRDNQMCQRCLIKYNLINTENLEVHHIKSRKDFPDLTWDDDNLICICSYCNKALGTKNKLDFEWNPKTKDFNLQEEDSLGKKS